MGMHKLDIGDTLRVINRYREYNWLGNIKETKYRVNELKVKAIFDNIILITVDDKMPQLITLEDWNELKQTPATWGAKLINGEFK